MNKLLKYLVFLIILQVCSAEAAVRVPAIFGENMVLQQGTPVPMWGWADAGEQVQVVFLGKSFTTKANERGEWHLKLGKYLVGGPYQMQIKGSKNELSFKNILIGDVWVASGQSNMEFGIKNERNGTEAVANAHDSLIHLFTVPIAVAMEPMPDIDPAKMSKLEGKWIVCTPENLVYEHSPWSGFSAIGYYFALQMRQTTHGPIGIIGVYKGGTPAQTWISLNGLRDDPQLSRYHGKHLDYVDSLAINTTAYPQKMALYKTAREQWDNDYGKDYNAAFKQWQADAEHSKAIGTPIPMRPKPLKPAPPLPIPPDGGFNGPGNLYNAMLNPVIHYGIKGVIWYQGENNGDQLTDAVFYKVLFPAMIKNWRHEWHQGNFPFIFVQLANFRDPAKTPSEGNWPWVREGQLNALEISNTGMAVITDLGEGDNIHPTNKKDVAARLSLIARSLVYHEKIISSGPRYKCMKIEGNKIILTFDEMCPLMTGNGLAPSGANVSELKGFGIAGADHQFYWAKAKLVDNTIIIYSDEVTNPLAVRYNWADNPAGNLYNQAGLPASPFRTDDWAAETPVVPKP